MLIGLDVDGVLVDYRAAYAKRWERAFGILPTVKNPTASSLWEYFGLPYLDEVGHAHWERFSDVEFWTTMPVIESALDACHQLREAGHHLVAVTAAPHTIHHFRSENLADFPLVGLHCVGVPGGERSKDRLISPKAAILGRLKPDYFVDDYIDYFAGVDRSIKRVLVNEPVNYVSGIVRMDEIDHVVRNLADALPILLAA